MPQSGPTLGRMSLKKSRPVMAPTLRWAASARWARLAGGVISITVVRASAKLVRAASVATASWGKRCHSAEAAGAEQGPIEQIEDLLAAIVAPVVGLVLVADLGQGAQLAVVALDLVDALDQPREQLRLARPHEDDPLLLRFAGGRGAKSEHNF